MTHWNDEGAPFTVGARPINRALRGLGQEVGDAVDEFDAFGLGNYRSYEDITKHAFPA